MFLRNFLREIVSPVPRKLSLTSSHDHPDKSYCFLLLHLSFGWFSVQLIYFGRRLTGTSISGQKCLPCFLRSLVNSRVLVFYIRRGLLFFSADIPEGKKRTPSWVRWLILWETLRLSILRGSRQRRRILNILIFVETCFFFLPYKRIFFDNSFTHGFSFFFFCVLLAER